MNTKKENTVPVEANSQQETAENDNPNPSSQEEPTEETPPKAAENDNPNPSSLEEPTEETPKEKFSSTLFDDIFRTMVENFPELIVAIINEVFGTDYPDDVEVLQYRNEHMEPGGKIITDSVLLIQGHFYHIECQSGNDGRMVIRMIAYDIAVALEHPVQVTVEGSDSPPLYHVQFPQSCVMYVMEDGKIPRELEMDLEFADGTTHRYHVPTVNVQGYTKQEIFEKHLLAFLPYYILRYRKQIQAAEGQDVPNMEDVQPILDDLLDVCSTLAKETEEQKKVVLYNFLIEMIQKITRYEFRKSPEELKKGVTQFMGGKAFQSKTIEVYRTAKAEGKAEGIVEGEEKKGREVYINCRNDGMTIEKATSIAGISSTLAETAEKDWQAQAAVLA